MQQLQNDVFKRKIEITEQSKIMHEGLRKEETQQHRDIENRPKITIENQLIEFRQKQHEKFKQIKKLHILLNLNENLKKWSRSTTLIVGDSILSGIEE